MNFHGWSISPLASERPSSRFRLVVIWRHRGWVFRDISLSNFHQPVAWWYIIESFCGDGCCRSCHQYQFQRSLHTIRCEGVAWAFKFFLYPRGRVSRVPHPSSYIALPQTSFDPYALHVLNWESLSLFSWQLQTHQLTGFFFSSNNGLQPRVLWAQEQPQG